MCIRDSLLIKALRIEKGWSVDRMIAEFPAKQWKRRTLYYFVRRIDSTGRVERLPGSGRLGYYRSVSSSFCCAFWCKHCNPRTSGSKVITRQNLCNFFGPPCILRRWTKRMWGVGVTLNGSNIHGIYHLQASADLAILYTTLFYETRLSTRLLPTSWLLRVGCFTKETQN